MLLIDTKLFPMPVIVNSYMAGGQTEEAIKRLFRGFSSIKHFSCGNNIFEASIGLWIQELGATEVKT